MKLDIEKFELYIVFKPTKYSEKEDVFPCTTCSITELTHIVKGSGKDTSDVVHAIFTTQDEAQEEADKLFKKHNILK